MLKGAAHVVEDLLELIDPRYQASSEDDQGQRKSRKALEKTGCGQSR